MKKNFLTNFLIQVTLFVICLGVQNAYGQNRRDGEGRIPESLQERLAEMRIRENKKEFKKLVKRSETVASLTKEIRYSYEKHKVLTPKDQKKLTKIRKLLKKIRRDLNAKENFPPLHDRKPKSISHAIDSLQYSTSQLFSAVKKITRHSISVTAVQSSNTTWWLVKFLRLKSAPQDRK